MRESFCGRLSPGRNIFYWAAWHLFDLNPLPYHITAWTLHTANVVLVFLLLAGISGSRYGAAIGALPFGFRANFVEIYWSFGTIFELLALLLMLVALRVHTSDVKPAWRVVVVSVLYLLAVKSKEMAITLPAILLLYDVCLRPERLTKRIAALYAVPGLFGAPFAYPRLSGYVPFFGIGGMAATLTSRVDSYVKVKPPVAMAAFALLSAGHYFREQRAAADLIQDERSIAVEYRKLAAALRSLPLLDPESEVYFRSFPRHFDNDVLTSATQTVLHRTDVKARVVEEFPAHCRSCVHIP